MKAFGIAALAAAVAQTASAHYIFTTLTYDGGSSTAAVRTPASNSPTEDATSDQMTCGLSPGSASETVSVTAGSNVGFELDNVLFHNGPAAFYLGKAPSDAASWDGSGDNWFKIAEWGATFDPFGFTDYNLGALNATIPAETPDGDYLLRVEQIGLHVAGAPQWYISCAQIAVTGGGSGSPSFVSIPGHESADDSGLTVNIYYPVPTEYTVPGPSVWPSGSDSGSDSGSTPASSSAAATSAAETSAAETSAAATSVAATSGTATSAVETPAESSAAPVETASSSEVATSAAASSPAASSAAASTRVASASAPAATSAAASTTAASAPATSSAAACTKDAYNCCWDAYNACAAQANAAQAGKGGNVDFSACAATRSSCLSGVSRRHARMWAA